MTPVTHLIVGPPRHGVVQFGCELHAAMLANGAASELRHVERHDEFAWDSTSSALHLQFTDRLFGTSPQEAVEAVTAIVTRADRAGRRITATLHDLPQPSDGDNLARRVQAYAAVCGLTHGVIVSSEHERDLTAALAPSRVAVVPLPITTDFHPNPSATKECSVGVFGYVYPGKGHLEVLTAIAGLATDLELVAIGQASDGHVDLVAELESRANDLGLRFRLTGYVTDDLPGVLRGIAVPVAPHRHVSASGSLNSWLSVGRRPLAPANRYTEEILHRNPGALALYPDTEAGLRTAISRALDDPGLTWLPRSTVCSPTAADAAAQYTRILQDWHR